MGGVTSVELVGKGSSSQNLKAASSEQEAACSKVVAGAPVNSGLGSPDH